jgi:DNA-binding beta-propeller fold protein YncE
MAEDFLIRGARYGRLRPVACAMLFLLAPLLIPAYAKSKPQPVPAPPDLLLEGGRKLSFESSFSAEREIRKPGFWGKVLDVVAGEPEMHEMVRPYSIAVDSHGRAIVSDPGASGVHIFDFEHHKYKFIERREKQKDPMLEPQCVAVDDQDTIYVTDSKSGKVFVFSPEGKLERTIGSLRGGEGYFKRPTGIAVDRKAGRIYVTDTVRHKIFTLDMDGTVLGSMGQNGSGDLQFNYPTELRMQESDLLVVDAMNFRVQRIGAGGEFKRAFGRQADRIGEFFRPKAIAIDSEGHYYIPDGMRDNVQVFDSEGQLLYSFGGPGTALGSFQLPSGIFIDKGDRVFVVDSYNRRVQVFRYYALHPSRGERP